MMQDVYERGGVLGDRRKAVIDQLRGGTAGPLAPPAGGLAPTPNDSGMAGATPAQASAPAPAPSGLGQYANRLEGFDAGKLNSAHDSPKYQIGRALSQFDPRQGVTPDVLAALNKLGIGEFAGSGDKLSIAHGDPRFEGVSSLDVVRGFKDPTGTGGWQYGVDGPAPSGGGAPGGGLQAPGGIASLLQGSGTSNIASALQQISGLSQPSRLQQLIAALGGQQ
jgi:hypothetical protein